MQQSQRTPCGKETGYSSASSIGQQIRAAGWQRFRSQTLPKPTDTTHDESVYFQSEANRIEKKSS